MLKDVTYLEMQMVHFNPRFNLTTPLASKPCLNALQNYKVLCNPAASHSFSLSPSITLLGAKSKNIVPLLFHLLAITPLGQTSTIPLSPLHFLKQFLSVPFLKKIKVSMDFNSTLNSISTTEMFGPVPSSPSALGNWRALSHTEGAY